MKKYWLILFFLIAQNASLYSDDLLNIAIRKDLNLELIKCSAGEFVSGCSPDEIGYIAENDMPLVRTSIDKDFYIGKYETTQAVFQAVMNENPSKNQGNDFPVEKVTYLKAVEFCQKLNEMTKGKRPQGFEFMLPTESQWEYACRAGTNTAINNGLNLTNAMAGCENLDKVAWYKYNSDKKTHSVGKKQPNGWGIYDMHGNVAEWCLSDLSDEKGLLRGGAYFYEPQKVRSASRGCSSINSVSSGFGFRVALVYTGKIEETAEVKDLKPDNELQDYSSKPLDNFSIKECADDSLPVIDELNTQETLSVQKPSSEKESLPENKESEKIIDKTLEKITEKPAEMPTINIAPVLKKQVIAGEKISVAVNGVKFPLIGCPADSFTMGSPSDEPCHKLRENQRQINIEKSFYIGKYEITQGQYKAITGNNPSIEIGDKLPVHSVNWLDAKKFCEKLNELTEGKRPENTVFTLPTEIQWEYACRAGCNTALNNGKNLVNFNSSDNELNKLAWYDANSGAKVQTVGKKIANSWGIHDMHGNIWEWCDTQVENSLNSYVLRGGSYRTKANECRSANSKEALENIAEPDFGFRVILIEK